MSGAIPYHYIGWNVRFSWLLSLSPLLSGVLVVGPSYHRTSRPSLSPWMTEREPTVYHQRTLQRYFLSMLC